MKTISAKGSVKPINGRNKADPAPSAKMTPRKRKRNDNAVATANAINSNPWWPGIPIGFLKRACKTTAPKPAANRINI
ncbi:MAG: hypothetical protein A2W93_03460 [Bacteroidetes bacterium GWF2_43_63]|nr:MAG: hypothetical protein A2W94_09460 [Bacteroidetes bacterium GWE2_42_42]OFY53714.1 MAG: hypothetical protein A2W93_03460 [Bacteroidetes bacterium GWF2_43_63]HBG70936.1 hypothetical protein [Bacteroidales bacterium]HCB62973.1 hypothetical protein [Bacteroidales bacterium]HCY24263.1 hypothetical protein [Bacteroidales bacterium]